MKSEQDRIERERREGLGTLGERATHAGMAAEQEEQRASNQGDQAGPADGDGGGKDLNREETRQSER